MTSIAELVQRRNQERDDAVLDRALRPYLIYDLAPDDARAKAYILPRLDIVERVTEILARYGYELVDVVWPERIEPPAPRWDPDDQPALARRYTAREREQFARETRE